MRKQNTEIVERSDTDFTAQPLTTPSAIGMDSFVWHGLQSEALQLVWEFLLRVAWKWMLAKLKQVVAPWWKRRWWTHRCETCSKLKSHTSGPQNSRARKSDRRTAARRCPLKLQPQSKRKLKGRSATLRKWQKVNAIER